MISKNWSGRSVLACGIISLLASGRGFPQAPPAGPTPAVALLDAADAAQWQAWEKALGWRVVTPAAPQSNAPQANIDLRVQELAKAVAAAVRDSGVDPARVYLAGSGEASASVFYTISRLPDLWAAAVALGGSPEAAIDTNRLFAANFATVPILWFGAGAGDEALANRLKAAKIDLDWRPASAFTGRAVFEWLAARHRDQFPAEIDCETNSPSYASCFWIQMTKFDAAERNDVLPSTHLTASPKPSLDLGAFGYKIDDPGPGLLISFLPEKYGGPLKMGDRIVALDGRPLADQRQYNELMAKYTEEKPVVVAVQRGKDRVRVETRVLLPHSEMMVTARVQAQYLPAEKEIQIVSRTVKEMRVTIPPHWAQGGRLYWNGLSLEKVDQPGCLLLTIDKELLHSAPCAN